MCSPKRSRSQSVFLDGVGCGTVMLKPLAVQGFRIVIQLALEGPLKFPQHRPTALIVDGLGVTDVTFEEVGPVTPLLPMRQMLFLTMYLCYHI